MAYKDDILKIWKEDLPWDKLSGANILITGATGLIGGCLVETLMLNPKKDYVVYASGRNENRAKNLFQKFWDDSHFNFIKYEVTQPLTCDVNFKYIIHAASGAAPQDFSSHPVEVMKANIEGVIHLMEYGLKHEMVRMLFVSSGEVYGEGDGREFIEDYSGYVNPILVRSCYPSSKRAAETLCVSYAAEYGVDTIIARPCHTYGPNFTESDNRVYVQFIRNILRNEDIVMKSAGSQYRSWCYVVDCVSALLYILLKGETCQAYNIADESSNITIRELSELIANIGGKKVVIDIPNKEEKSGYNTVRKSIYSNTKLKELGWQTCGSIDVNLRNTIEHLRKY